jgi:hypothetical protein
MLVIDQGSSLGGQAIGPTVIDFELSILGIIAGDGNNSVLASNSPVFEDDVSLVTANGGLALSNLQQVKAAGTTEHYQDSVQQLKIVGNRGFSGFVIERSPGPGLRTSRICIPARLCAAIFTVNTAEYGRGSTSRAGLKSGAVRVVIIIPTFTVLAWHSLSPFLTYKILAADAYD